MSRNLPDDSLTTNCASAPTADSLPFFQRVLTRNVEDLYLRSTSADISGSFLRANGKDAPCCAVERIL